MHQDNAGGTHRSDFLTVKIAELKYLRYPRYLPDLAPPSTFEF
jgi:hypothetical protein